MVRNLNTTKRVRFFIVGVVAIALACVALVRLTASTSPANSPGTAGQHLDNIHKARANVSAAIVTAPIRLPGYSEPLALVGDPTGGGVWFIAASKSEEAIFHWNASAAQLAAFPFATSTDPLPFALTASLTVSPSGTVWAGIHDTLVRLDPSTGAVQRIAIPQIPADSALLAGGSGQLSVPLSAHVITGVVSEPDGNIAISLSFSSVVLNYNPSSGQFSQITSLPAIDVPTGIDVSPAGTLTLIVHVAP